MRYLLAICFTAVCVAPPLVAQELPASIETIRSVGKEGENNPAASRAWSELAKGDASQLTVILRGMKDANPIARNLLRGAFETIAERELDAGNALPMDALREFLADHENDPAARRVALEWIVRVEPEAKNRMLAEMLNDPSLEIRYDAVALALEKAVSLKDDDKSAAIRAYKVALAAARNEQQVNEAADALRELGEEVDLPQVFGFLVSWHLIGPFDNVGGVGFDAVYPPEQGIDLSATYEGKEGQVGWIEHTTSDPQGMVDLNKALDKHKGAAAYAFHEFDSDKEQYAELRLGCICANKVWLNGELLSANEVYHAGARFDQYIGKSKLRKGKNEILVKVCQNEQTENWAEVWEFQLRVCDQYGTAILSQSRPEKLSAARSTSTERLAIERP